MDQFVQKNNNEYHQSITVSELNYLIKSILDYEQSLNDIKVIGEITNARITQKKHCFFNLIDQSSSIPCVMWNSDLHNGSQQIQNGNLVICSGKISTYLQTGLLQLYVNNIQTSGRGDIQKEFNELKTKLANEGLFDENRKRSIPKFPKKICVITSKHGAVIKDITNIISRRYPIVDLSLIPVSVQGLNSSKEISEAIKKANKINFDIIILARGGGNIDDFKTFNDENLARIIFSSKIPIISAVGHESDYTISDFVADLRAPTPSAAAEISVPSSVELIKDIKNLKKNLTKLINEKILTQVRFYENSLDRLLTNAPNLILYKQKNNFLIENLQKNIVAKTKFKTQEFKILNNSLKFLNPSDNMARGLVQTINSKRKIIKSIKDIKQGEDITISYIDGKAVTKVINLKNK